MQEEKCGAQEDNFSEKKKEVKRFPQIGRIAMWRFSFLFVEKWKEIF